VYTRDVGDKWRPDPARGGERSQVTREFVYR